MENCCEDSEMTNDASTAMINIKPVESPDHDPDKNNINRDYETNIRRTKEKVKKLEILLTTKQMKLITMKKQNMKLERKVSEKSFEVLKQEQIISNLKEESEKHVEKQANQVKLLLHLVKMNKKKAETIIDLEEELKSKSITEQKLANLEMQNLDLMSQVRHISSLQRRLNGLEEKLKTKFTIPDFKVL